MLTVIQESQTCSVCGKESLHKIPKAPATEDYRDLDQRPGEADSGTMALWIQECPHCGFISLRLSDRTLVTQDWLKGEAFTTCGGRTFSSPLAERFYKFYLICRQDNSPAAAFYAVRCAAWVCDDDNDAENAAHCRQCALAAYDEITEMAAPTDPHIQRELPLIMEDLFVIRADLLRRLGQFDQVLTEYAEKQFIQTESEQVIAFQLEKCRLQDAQRYSLGVVPGINPDIE